MTHNIKPGVATGDQVQEIFRYAKEKGFALPAVNVTSSSTINASLETAAKLNSPIIIQFSNGGGCFMAGKGLSNDNQQAAIAGSIAGAKQVHELAELYGLPESRIRDNFDLYRNGLIIWSSSMEAPVKVSKPCSSIDILPTVSNLFGLEYDSRLITGKDILSDSEGLVILN